MQEQRQEEQGLQPIKRALLSVSNKEGLVELAQVLSDQGIALVSTGGTAALLKEKGFAVSLVKEVTGFPEIMGGRVKSLHPAIYGGILARRNLEKDLNALKEQKIDPIDLVVCNLYPFAQTIAKGVDAQEALEQIDIGGPSMVRAAAKNHPFVTIATDPKDYGQLCEELGRLNGATSFAFRQKSAAKAFAHTAAYDSCIAEWFAQEEKKTQNAEAKSSNEDESSFPETLSVQFQKKETLRYGENPQQKAAFYIPTEKNSPFGEVGLGQADQRQGKALSYNNLNDSSAAYHLVQEFSEPAVVIVKHANPCGVGLGANVQEAYKKALACDPVSAFGGIVALNRPLDETTAQEIATLFTEVVLVPEVSDAARKVFEKKKNLRLLVVPFPSFSQKQERSLLRWTCRSVAGGLLVQDQDRGFLSQEDCTVVTDKQPTPQEWKDLLFLEAVSKHVKSNAIVYGRNGQTLGVGAGQMSRVDAARIARDKSWEIFKSKDSLKNAVMASDAFFPFADGLQVGIDAGISAVIQPGGSKRDPEVIEVANQAGIALVLTGVRHFNH